MNIAIVLFKYACKRLSFEISVDIFRYGFVCFFLHLYIFVNICVEVYMYLSTYTPKYISILNLYDTEKYLNLERVIIILRTTLLAS